MHRSVLRLIRLLLVCAVIPVFTPAQSARATEGWPEVFDPFRVETLYFLVDSNAWEMVRNDTNIYFPDLVFRTPAEMWTEGELPITVEMRRKKDAAIPSEEDPQKVALKIDINQYVPGQEWRDLRKLSLENGGGGSGAIRDGIAMNLHRLAAEAGFYDYQPGYSAWVRVVVNGDYVGLYSSPEQRDKQFMRNRGMYKPGSSWLYEFNTLTNGGGHGPILDTSVATNNSPTHDTLCFQPFRDDCPQPSIPNVQDAMEAILMQEIDMQGMLTFAAIESFIAYGDGLFTKGNKNSYSTEFLPGMQAKRQYYPWDLDSGFSNTSWDIYAGGPGQVANRRFQTDILAHPWFNQEYRNIYQDLINGPFSYSNLTAFLDELEPILAPYIAEDPYLSSDFSDVRSYFAARIPNVQSQIGTVVRPPVFGREAGEFTPGFQLHLSHSNSTGTIYYTTDGSDPRGIGGVLSGTPYTGPLTLTSPTHIRARVLDGSNWSALRKATYNTAGHAAAMAFTEIMYHPQPPLPDDNDSRFEFIELQNTGATPVDLTGHYLTGVDFRFPTGFTVPPGDHVLLINNPVSFESRYPGISYDGTYWGGLSKTGEKIRLRNAEGNTLTSVEYDDDHPWVQGANGFGYSLVNVNPEGDPDDPANWRESAAIYGSPGTSDPESSFSPGIVVNEVLAHTDPPFEDAVELYNTTPQSIDISGWYLSDDLDLLDPTRSTLKKFKIPAGTIIPPYGFRVFYESEFNPSTNNSHALIPFALSSRGEAIWLSSADGSGALTGHIVGFRFGASDNGISMGRHPTSMGKDITFLEHTTFGITNPADPAEFRTGTGAVNAAPRTGPVILSEIMYHPDAGSHEFIEFENISASIVDLAGWSLEGANYVFPSNSIVHPRGLLILLATTNLPAATFRSDHNVPPEVPIYRHDFDMDNAGEKLILSKPNDPPLDPPIMVDYVRYNDRSPWPVEADGEGPSLERIAETAYGNEALSWRASVNGGTPGRAGVFSNVIAIATNSTWKYHGKGFNLDVPWRHASYSDSGWDANDGILGIGQPFITTTLDFSPSGYPPITTYFRKEFVISDPPGRLERLQLETNYDDGFVAYLNGQEIARRSMPDGIVQYDTLATSHSGGSYEAIDLLAFTNLLQYGRNVLAVEVHQASSTDSDLVWDASLSYSATPELIPFTVLGIAWEPEGNVVIEWSSISGRTYRVEKSGDLLIWSELSGSIGATGTVSRVVHPVSSHLTNEYFRIRASE
jgi:hypothetical protein